MTGNKTSETDAWLGPTEMIDAGHATILGAAARVILGSRSDRERALRVYRFVRDEIEFGWKEAFYEMKASEVLLAGCGFCSTKATLFIAMLRAAGIPARQRFVDLNSKIMDGLVRSGGPFVDHSYTEVLLDGRWFGVDSYVIDRPLFVRAKARLESEGKGLGYGIHANGVNDWDGRSDSFVQFVDDGRIGNLSLYDHGVFDDVAEFYASASEAWNRVTPDNSIAMRRLLPQCNRNVARLRGGTTQDSGVMFEGGRV